jgi:hypothetical protein
MRAQPSKQRRRLLSFFSLTLWTSIDGYTKGNGPILSHLLNQLPIYQPDQIHSFTIIPKDTPTAKRSHPRHNDFHQSRRISNPRPGAVSLREKGVFYPETPGACTMPV